MKAVAAGKPGEVLLADLPEPTLGKGDIIVAPLACGVCSTDLKMIQKGNSHLEYALGHEVSAIVIESTPEAHWKVGDQVVVAPYLPCGQCFFCSHGQPALCKHLYDVSLVPGGMSERIFVKAELAERGTFALPVGMDPIVAALGEPLGCAVKGLQDARIKSGDRVLVIGDGPMGMMSAGAARCMGAQKVMVSGMTPHRLQMAAAHFADEIIDVNSEDISTRVKELTDSYGADVVMVAVSSGEALATAISLVRAGGSINAFAGVPDGTQIPLDVRGLHYRQYFLTGSSGLAPDQLKLALDMLGAGCVDFGAMITKKFSFLQYREAYDYAFQRKGLKAMVTFDSLERKN